MKEIVATSAQLDLQIVCTNTDWELWEFLEEFQTIQNQ